MLRSIGLFSNFSTELVLSTHASSVILPQKGRKGVMTIAMDDKLQVGFQTMYSTEGRNITEEDIYMTIKIAGISNYVKINQIGEMAGVLQGYVEKEPNNPVNPEAIAIYTKEGEQVGYVPETDIKKVSDFSKDLKMSCLLQILPFKDKNGELGMKGKAILLKLYQGKVDLMQKFMDERGVQLLHETNVELNEFQGKLSEMHKDVESIELGEELEDEFDFSIYSYALAPVSEKSANLEDNIVEFEVEDINRYINVVFVDPEEKGCFAGYVLDGELYNNDGLVIGHVPARDLPKVNALANGRKLFCLYTVLDSLTPSNERCLASRVIAFKLFDDDDDYNYMLLGKFTVGFMEAATEYAKGIFKKKAKLTQHGEELKISNEYYDYKKQAQASSEEGNSGNGGCFSILLVLVSLISSFLF